MTIELAGVSVIDLVELMKFLDNLEPTATAPHPKGLTTFLDSLEASLSAIDAGAKKS